MNSPWRRIVRSLQRDKAALAYRGVSQLEQAWQLLGRHVGEAFISVRPDQRSEPLRAIIDEIATGMAGEYQVIEDRAHAINVAISTARADDTVLVAGKGHESCQEIAGVRHPFSDSEIAQRALSVWTPKERWPT